MEKQKQSLQEKLKILDQKKQELLDKRRHEILKIIERTNSLEINDKVLAGALLFLSDPTNKNHSILEDFKKYLDHKKTKAVVA